MKRLKFYLEPAPSLSEPHPEPGTGHCAQEQGVVAISIGEVEIGTGEVEIGTGMVIGVGVLEIGAGVVISTSPSPHSRPWLHQRSGIPQSSFSKSLFVPEPPFLGTPLPPQYPPLWALPESQGVSPAV